MDRKKVCKKSSAKKKMMSIEFKREILEKHEQGVRDVDLSRQYGRSTSMICSVLKRKESIKSVTPAKGLTIISKLRTSLHENMEKLLMVWVTEKQLQGDTLTQTIICEKARAIYGDLLKQTPQTSIDEASEESFKASRGWFENFKKRSGIHSVVTHGEAASSDMKAAEDYIKTFSDLIKAQGYISQQVFNCDETGLFWKKMPNRTYITAEEKMIPGHKPMKDRLTLALCANASGDCKIKPLLVYHSENPRAFKSHKILKEKLQVMWRSNPKAWVTRKFFVEWVNLVFGPTVKKYLQGNNLPVQALLFLDNAPAHPPNFEDDILEELKFIKVLYLPPNTTLILQPMDQQTWLGVTTKTLTSAWKKLWPEAVAERIYEELEPGVSVEEEIVSLGKSMGLEVEERDVNELIEEHTQELTTEEIQELQSQQHTEVMQVIGFEESVEEVISTSEIKEILGMWERVSQFVEKNTQKRLQQGKSIEMLHRATTRFIADRVPDGAKLGMVKFSTDASVVSPLTKVDNTTRVRLLSQIPNSVNGWTAIGKALNTGLKVLGPQSQGGMIVLVTDDKENRGPSIVDVTPSIQKAGVTVNAVAFGDRASIKLEQLIKATDGVGFHFDRTEKTLAKIDMAFLSSMTSQYDVKEQPVTVKDCARAANSLVLDSILHHLHGYLPPETPSSWLQARLVRFVWGTSRVSWIPRRILARPVSECGVGLLDIASQLRLDGLKGVQGSLCGAANRYSWLICSRALVRGEDHRPAEIGDPPIIGLTSQRARRVLDSARVQEHPVAELAARWISTVDVRHSIPLADLRRNCFSRHDADVALRLALHALPHPDHPASRPVRSLLREVFASCEVSLDLQAWLFGVGLHPKAVKFTSVAKATIFKYYLGLEVLNERASVNPRSPTLRSFSIDSQLGARTTVIFISPTINQVQVRLMSPLGRRYEAGSPEYLFDQANQQIKIIFLKAESGRWFAEIRASKFSDVSWVVTSEPKNPKNQPVRIKSWIGDLELTFPTVARVYAQVSRDYEPVLGARIVATIDRPMGSLVDIVLLDNGVGADGTRDDGIYTAYFTQFNGNGRYSVVARAVNSGQAGVRIKRRFQQSRSPPLPKPSHPFEKESTTRFPLEDFTCREDELPEEDPRNLLEDFERSAFTGAFRVQAFPKDGMVKDVFPPFPVTDLRVTKIDGDEVSLRWTSPVSSIEVRFGENFKTLLKNFTSSKMVVEKDLVNGTLDPPPPGHYHEISIKVPISLEEPKTVFFAVVGVDKSGKRAESFSIFPANLGKLCRDPYNFTLVWKIWVAIILLVAVISIVFVIIYSRRRRQKDKTSSVASSNS
ncbi:hypothetical protein LAZ67_13002933 [Cordylochernes scorpioides]|uniref:Tigger transposable element-derived protein 1 n=1 Tax=Cordylochernes scorpioides TaxID=51811 RepID=A0ABY6L9L3_9ARAC|nr:hypothetical protein LAZ67_13002933 [Cordylochernes scorpioides]